VGPAPARGSRRHDAIYYQSKNTGQVPFGWERPDGFPDNAAAWSSAARLMGSFHLHYTTAGGYWSNTGVTCQLHDDCLPQSSIHFDALVDHLCRALHGRRSTSLVLGARCCVHRRRPVTIRHHHLGPRAPQLPDARTHRPAPRHLPAPHEMTGQMTLNETCSCSDYTTSRRSFLRNAAVVSAGAVATTMFGDAFRQASYAATNGNVMVVLSLRGGADGLSIVVPHGDAAYYDARPVIAVPRASLLVRDDMFGLHPGLKPLESMWTAGKFAAVHATGLPQPYVRS